MGDSIWKSGIDFLLGQPTDETLKNFIDHNAALLSKGESAEVSQQLRDSSSSGYRLLEFGSGKCLCRFADDTGGLSSPTNKFTAHKQKTEFNIPQLHNYQNVEPHWAPILHQEQVAVENKGYESVKELPLQDAGYAMIAEFQASNFQTEISPPLQEFKEFADDVLVLVDSHQLPLGEDTIHKNKRRLIVGVEKDNSNIHVLDKTCIEETSKEGKSLEKCLSYDILSAHFGTPQDDTAKFFNGYESFKELPLQDAGYAMIAEFQASNFQTEKSPPLQEFKEIEDNVLVLDDSHQLPLGEDTIHKNKRRLTVGAEKDISNIHVLDKTCIEETSKEGKSLEKGLSYDILSAHFGTPQDDAAKFFNVSRSTFKRICRGHGIKRWQSKKKLHSQSPSKLRRVNDEELSRTNSYCSGIPPLQAADVITVKATYNGVAIIFEVLDSSGMVDLEDNVIERLKMERDTFSIKYQDDEGDWVLIACDNDLRKCLKTSRLLKKTTVKMLIDRPINHYAS